MRHGLAILATLMVSGSATAAPPTATAPVTPPAATAPGANVPVVDFTGSAIIIDAESTLLELPPNAPKTLVVQRQRIDDLRAKLTVEKSKIAQMLHTMTFDDPSPILAQAKAAIEKIEAQIADLEAIENGYIQERDLFLSETRTSQATGIAGTAPVQGTTPAH